MDKKPRITLLTKAEAAKPLNVSEDTLEMLMKTGVLPYYKIAKTCVRINEEDVMEYIASRRRKSDALRHHSQSSANAKTARGVCPYKPGDRVVEP